MEQMYNIAAIVTCFNRKETTLKSLSCLFKASENCHTAQIKLHVYLTDDCCTDGTADAVRRLFSNQDIHIVQSGGNAYWAGGMRLAWHEAMRDSQDWDFYLLFNDDTYVEPNSFDTLIQTHYYAVDKYGKPGVYSGLICGLDDPNKITYGGNVYRGLFGRAECIDPKGNPVECKLTNANLLLISRDVVDSIGIFDDRFFHSCADWDYGIRASDSHFPVLVTGIVCGRCNFDHDNDQEVLKKVSRMSIRERKAFFSHPLRATSDLLLFMKKHYRYKYLVTYLARKLNIYAPRLYYCVTRLR